ncbi:MAG: hypothetical protein ACN4IE_10890, partial [Ilumatobacter sp.]
VPAPSVVDRVVPWLLRLAWIAVLVAGGAAIDGAAAGRSDTVGNVARYTGFAGWVIGVAAMAVPAVVSLTAARVVVPLAIPIAVVSLVAGADGLDGVFFLVGGLLATVIVFSAELGRTFAQASAYGEEDRHLLRPPAAYAAASVLAWAIWAAVSISAPLLLADGRWISGVAAAIVAIVLGVFGWPRWHRLSTRWFVIVPIGVVVHDSLVLGETLMLRRQELAAVRLAPADTEAADLTGPTAGHAIEISTLEPVTVHLAATPKAPRGNVIHMRAGLVAPSRPGRALSAAADRRLPVG